MSNRENLKRLARMLVVYSNATIPQTYMNEMSNYELLLTIMQKVNEIIGRLSTYDDVINEIINYLGTLDDAVIEYLEDLKESGWIAEQIKNASQKKILIIGDSYTEGQGVTYEQCYVQLLRNNGFDITAIHSSGGGFINFGANGTFDNLVQNYNNPDATTFTDVLFLGGVNDSINVGLDNLPNAIAQTMEHAHEKFTNARIHVGYFSQLYRADGNATNVKKTINYYRTQCYTGNYCYIENAEYMLKHPSYISSSDGVHPTVAGHRRIAGFLTSYLINGSFSTSYAETVNFRLDGPTGGIIGGTVFQDNGITRFDVPADTAFTFNNVLMELNGTSAFKVGDLVDSIIYGQTNGAGTFAQCKATLAGVITYADSADQSVENAHSVVCPLTLLVYQNGLFLVPQLLENQGAYLTKYVRQININPFSVVFSTLDV